MKWISVKDELPEGEVLAIGYQNEYIIGFISIDENTEGWFMVETDNEMLYEVTHWMPLPEPPKE